MKNNIQEFDPKMPLTDIWFDLNVGQVRTSEEGEINKKIFLSRGIQVSARDVSDINIYRKELYRLLDEAIDSLEIDIPFLQKNGNKIMYGYCPSELRLEEVVGANI